jgi:hypothetical protein
MWPLIGGRRVLEDESVMRLALIFAVALIGGCTHTDNRHFCTAVATKQYADYREYTEDDPPLRPSEIDELIANCLNDLK